MFLSSAAALLFSVSSMAESIYFPEEFVPLQVNERILESSFFSNINDVQLTPGHYYLKLKYSDLYEMDFDDHEVIESAPFWVNVTIEANKDYVLVFHRADNVVSARVFAQVPEVSLQVKGSQLSEPLNIIKKNPFMTSQSMPINSKKTVINNKAMPSAVQMLNFWWQQATPAQQKEFLENIAK